VRRATEASLEIGETRTQKDYTFRKIVSRVDGKESGLKNPTIKDGRQREELELHIVLWTPNCRMQTTCAELQIKIRFCMRTSPYFICSMGGGLKQKFLKARSFQRHLKARCLLGHLKATLNRGIKGTKKLKELIVKNCRCLKNDVQPLYFLVTIDVQHR